MATKCPLLWISSINLRYPFLFCFGSFSSSFFFFCNSRTPFPTRSPPPLLNFRPIIYSLIDLGDGRQSLGITSISGFVGFLDFWIIGFLDYWIFGLLDYWIIFGILDYFRNFWIISISFYFILFHFISFYFILLLLISRYLCIYLLLFISSYQFLNIIYLFYLLNPRQSKMDISLSFSIALDQNTYKSILWSPRDSPQIIL